MLPRSTDRLQSNFARLPFWGIGSKPFWGNPLFSLLLMLSSLTPSATLLQPLTPPIGNSAKIDDFLQRMVASEPGAMVSIIVQTQGNSEEVEHIVRNAGGQITTVLSIINGFAANVPVTVITQLQQSAAVRRVSLDTPVQSQSEEQTSALRVQDDFMTIAYNGSSGTFTWLSDWEEIGEANGAALGDVAVVPFWGGALQGLRLQKANKGALRHVDLSQALDAQVQIAYRRKGFQSANDYVVLQASTDGVTWADVARWAGPMTDSQIQYEAYRLTAYRSGQTALRLLTSPTMEGEARFYVDSLEIDFIPTWDRTAQAAYQLYLPLVALEAGGTMGATEARLSKAERSAPLNAGGIACNDYCIDLAQVSNTYVKSVHADQLWNTPPYPRGSGVRVAVVDSGISPHPDLADYFGNTRVITQVNFVAGSTLPDDFYGHGTHIAGTIAGAGYSSSGAYMGVAPEAELIDVKVMDDWGRGNTADVLAGLEWIYNNRERYQIGIVNLSLNSTIPQSYHESPLNAALEVLWFNRIVVVVSAGNGGTQKLYPPANDPFVITVGALDDKNTADPLDDALAAFSANGMTADGLIKPDLVAPGTNIVAPLSGDDNNLTWAHPENKVLEPYNTHYYRMSGTSMAAAVVTGAVALLLEDEPSLTPDQVKHRLRATARPVTGGDSCTTGAGALDIQAAVNGTTVESANIGIAASQMLWTGITPVNWSSVNWSSVNWSSVNWSSVNWSSVNWSSVNWSSVNWSSVNWSSANTSNSNSSSSGNCIAAIRKLMLVNADTDRDIQPIYQGAIINLDAIGTRNLSLRIETTGAVESVKFALNNFYTKVENGAPYSLVGDNNGNYNPYFFINGTHKLKVTTYSGANAGGVAGASQELDFVVASGNRCELENGLRAQNNNTPVRFHVYNNTPIPLELFWLNSSGQRQSYGTIDPQATRSLTSYATHPWLIARDSDDACVRLIPDVGHESTVVIDPLFTGIYQITALHSNKCLDLVSNSTADGVAVQQVTCNGSTTQQWRIELVDKGAYRLLSVNSNKALDVNGAYPTNGAKVQQWSYNGTMNQKWRIEAAGDGAYWLIAVHSGKVLDVTGSALTDNASVTQWTNTGGNNQKWRLAPSN